MSDVWYDAEDKIYDIIEELKTYHEKNKTSMAHKTDLLYNGDYCPSCGSAITSVIDNRVKQDGHKERKRECKKCGCRYMTGESVIRIVKEYR